MKPLDIKNKYGIILGLIVLIFAIIGYVDKGKKFYEIIVPDKNILNWRFFLFLSVLLTVTIWYWMNNLWNKEFQDHQKTKFEKENLERELKTLENERLVDIITGVPNLRSLENDISKHLQSRRVSTKMQFILIDLRNFGKINKSYGFMKTNSMLRMIAQGIYKTMRRNEDMYKYPISNKGSNENFYRIHSGGDEFAFIIEGDQSDAIGFVNRLVPKFSAFSDRTEEILGKHEDLSFYGAIVEMSPRDDFEDVLERAHGCYNLAKEGNSPFTLSWFPDNIESTMNDSGWQKKNYENARRLFDVKIISNLGE